MITVMSSTSPMPATNNPSTRQSVRSIPGSYGWPVVGPLTDRLDYFWFRGQDEFFRKRVEKHKSTVFRTNVPPCFPFFSGVNPNVIAVLDCNSFSHLFDMEIVEKKNVLVGDFMPSISYTGDTRVCAYLDTLEDDHAKAKKFAIDILKRSSRVWVSSLLSSLDTMWNSIDESLLKESAASYFLPLQKCLFRFLTKSIVGADPASSPEISESGYIMMDTWLALQILPTVYINAFQPLVEIFLHSFAYPFALVRGDENKMKHNVISVSPSITAEYIIPESNDSLKPYVAQLFPNLHDAIAFYEAYAAACGFTVRVCSTKKNNDIPPTVIWKHLCCNREGYKVVSPYSEFNQAVSTDGDVVKRRRISNRCGCEAKCWLKYEGNDGYRVTKLEYGHTHAMLELSHMVFSKGNRQVTPFHQEIMMNCIKSNIGVSKSFKVYKNLVGSYANVGATVVDFKNFMRGLNSYMEGSDAQMVINDFLKKKERCNAYYFDYDVNKEGQLCRLFWCDPINRKSFSYFGDVVSTDATYQLIRYNMVFIPFTGVDNHKRSITFAAALLLHEDIDSYVWLFENFKKAMGHEPHVIITDQAAYVKAAVERVFTHSVHRLCMWHIMMKVANKVKFPPNTNPSIIDSFQKKFKKIVWSDELTPIEFENEWF